MKILTLLFAALLSVVLMTSRLNAVSAPEETIERTDQATVKIRLSWEGRSMTVEVVSLRDGTDCDVSLAFSVTSGTEFAVDEFMYGLNRAFAELKQLDRTPENLKQIYLGSIFVREWRTRLSDFAPRSEVWKIWLSQNAAGGFPKKIPVVCQIMNDGAILRELESKGREFRLAITVKDVEGVVVGDSLGGKIPLNAMVWLSVDRLKAR